VGRSRQREGDIHGGATRTARSSWGAAHRSPARAALALTLGALIALGGALVIRWRSGLEPEGPAGTRLIRFEGEAILGPTVLDGREAFVAGCGQHVPLGPDLRFVLEAPPKPCWFAVYVVNPDGTVVIGPRTGGGPEGGADPAGVEHQRLRLGFPERYLGQVGPWDGYIRRMEDEIASGERACARGNFGLSPWYPACVREKTGRSAIDLAWMEEVAPAFAALNGAAPTR
jgi:hypothetical protein